MNNKKELRKSEFKISKIELECRQLKDLIDELYYFSKVEIDIYRCWEPLTKNVPEDVGNMKDLYIYFYQRLLIDIENVGSFAHEGVCSPTHAEKIIYRTILDHFLYCATVEANELKN